jgi:hypothetical protein
MFECWNGGQAVYHNQQPAFVFQFPAQGNELLSFFQLSGRICELLSGYHRSSLVMGGVAYDIPDFPQREVELFVEKLQATMGYRPVTRDIMAPDGFGMMYPMRITLWANLGTGRADMYNPMYGMQPGMQFLQPQLQFQPAFYSSYNMQLQQNGQTQGEGKKNTLQKISGILKDINEMLTQGNNVLNSGSKMYDFFS